MLEFVATHKYERVLFHQLEPMRNMKPKANETRKRQQGIEVAKAEGYTHFFLADADELYFSEEVEKAKLLFNDPSVNGLVCPLRVYVGKPTLWCEEDTLISFIHKLNRKTSTGDNPRYPFAYDKKGIAHIDGTRRINETNGIRKCDVVCQHYSYVRSNINMKIKNSTANLSKREDLIKRDIERSKPGYFSEIYHQPLKESENYFNIIV